MSAGRYDITIEQGASYEVNIQIKNNATDPYDLTGCSARAQVRDSVSSAVKMAEFTATVTDAINGKLNLSLTATQTAAISLPPVSGPSLDPSEYVWDLEVVLANSKVLRILEGSAFISPEVTK